MSEGAQFNTSLTAAVTRRIKSPAYAAFRREKRPA